MEILMIIFIINVIIKDRQLLSLNQQTDKYLEDILLNLGIKIIKVIFLILNHFYSILILIKNIVFQIIKEYFTIVVIFYVLEEKAFMN